MRYTPPNGLRGDFLGVRFLSIRAAIVGLFPCVIRRSLRRDPRSHARARCQHTVIRHQMLSRPRYQCQQPLDQHLRFHHHVRCAIAPRLL
jgi:hypothetical protein